ncbi:MAG: hypothetical protein DHS20C02_15290 [Micavibrio sp.]|nr:MAG: hypothetical protein DHS20C02_15290 [Micavibrio sp.]
MYEYENKKTGQIPAGSDLATGSFLPVAKVGFHGNDGLVLGENQSLGYEEKLALYKSTQNLEGQQLLATLPVKDR